MKRVHVFTILVLFTTVFCGDRHALPADPKSHDKGKGKVAVFEVPTSGKIIDVNYSPEFEEWWVKCREGDNIVVYTLGKSSKTWGKAVFEPQKPGTKTDKPATAAKPGADQSVRTEPQAETGEGSLKEAAPPAAVPTRPAPKKEEPATERKKWWDPLQILKKL